MTMRVCLQRQQRSFRILAITSSQRKTDNRPFPHSSAFPSIDKPRAYFRKITRTRAGQTEALLGPIRAVVVVFGPAAVYSRLFVTATNAASRRSRRRHANAVGLAASNGQER